MRYFLSYPQAHLTAAKSAKDFAFYGILVKDAEIAFFGNAFIKGTFVPGNYIFILGNYVSVGLFGISWSSSKAVLLINEDFIKVLQNLVKLCNNSKIINLFFILKRL